LEPKRRLNNDMGIAFHPTHRLFIWTCILILGSKDAMA
jgi:hypothetical protein